MNEKADALRKLRDFLKAVETDCAGALQREKSIAEPLRQAVDAATRLYDKISEGKPENGYEPQFKLVIIGQSDSAALFADILRQGLSS